MMSSVDPLTRVLAIDPTSKGFGFVLIEQPHQLVEWGTRTARGDKKTACLAAVEKLCDRYEPDVLILEDSTVRGFRRCARVRVLIQAIAAGAIHRGIRVRFVSRARAVSGLALHRKPTKDQVARLVAARFPELTPHLPPLRRPWMSEDERMGIFDAAALGLVALDGPGKIAKAA